MVRMLCELRTCKLLKWKRIISVDKQGCIAVQLVRGGDASIACAVGTDSVLKCGECVLIGELRVWFKGQRQGFDFKEENGFLFLYFFLFLVLEKRIREKEGDKMGGKVEKWPKCKRYLH